MRRIVLLAVAAVVTGVLLALAGAFSLVSGDDPESATVAVRGVDPAALATAEDLGATITALQDRLRAQPADAASWATLGLAYVEQARITGNPTYYPKAAGVLQRSFREQPDDNALALAGRAALASARHEFADALRSARAALRVDPYQLGALSIRVDALTELGRYDEALVALGQADRRRPSLQIFARYSYSRELHGDAGAAAVLLDRALDSSSTAADRAYLLALSADLDRKAGRLAAADRALDEALRADADNLGAAASRARLAVARGNLDSAERLWRELVERAPLPEYVLSLGELYQGTGRPRAAQRQYDVVEATARLARRSGVDTDLETARYEADHGSPSDALQAARSVWSVAPSIWAADALAWALHGTGRDAAALRYSRTATRLGTEDALLWIHRGTVELALGKDAAGADHLRRGLAADAGLSPWQVQQAQRALAEAGAPR